VRAVANITTGKTHTMFGSFMHSDNSDRGLIPLLCEYILLTNKEIKPLPSSESEHSDASSSLQQSIACMCYEIYQEKIYDLLSEHTTRTNHPPVALNIRENKTQGVFVEGCTEHKVSSLNNLIALLTKGYSTRRSCSTALNSTSSRSHVVFQLHIPASNVLDNVGRTFSRLTLVDLAGSERQKNTNTSGVSLKEGNIINKSLSALGKVINELSCQNSLSSSSAAANAAATASATAMVDSSITDSSIIGSSLHVNNNSSSSSSSSSSSTKRKRSSDSILSTPSKTKPMMAENIRHTHVSYRDSKLTQLLRESLGGTAKVSRDIIGLEASFIHYCDHRH
jgi:hypothetical protein